MSDTVSSVSAEAGSTAAKSHSSKKTESKPSHPPTSEMVNAAIAGLNERGGSSLRAIKKYIAANFQVDSEKLAPYIKRYLKSAVASGTLSQPKGQGASGSFKIAAEKPKATKSGVERKVKKPAANKTIPSKPTVKSPTKMKIGKKPLTKKPKSPKSKKTKIPKSAATKKI